MTQDPSESVNARVYFDSQDHYEAEIKARNIFSILSVLCGEYIWERDPPKFDLFQTDSRLHVSSFGISMNFGDGCLDEWYLIEQLFRLSEQCTDICIGFPEADTDPILVEAGDVLPSWVHETSDIMNRVFVQQGGVLVIIPSERNEVPSMVAGAEYLLGVSVGKYPGTTYLRNKQVNGVVHQKRLSEASERLKYPLHVSKMKLSLPLAKLLTAFPQLISVIVEHLPIDPDVNKVISANGMNTKFSSSLTTCSVQFTRLQWAKLASMTAKEVAPILRTKSSDLVGQLLLSGLCCAMVRVSKMLPLCMRGVGNVERALATCERVDPSNKGVTDDTWLYETPPENEARIETEPAEFTKLLENFFDESDDCSSSEDGHHSEDDVDDEELREFESEFAKLRMDDDDSLTAFMESMNSEGSEFVGPASVLFANLAKR